MFTVITKGWEWRDTCFILAVMLKIRTEVTGEKR